MNIVLASVNNKSYQALADITCANKQAYADKYGYKTYFKNSDFKYIPNDNIQSTPNNIGWEKINTILEAFEKYPDADYVWLSDCDSMITNKYIDIKSVIIAGAESPFIVSCDRGGINTGQIICAFHKFVIDYLKEMLSKSKDYRDENQYIIANKPNYLEVTPQKLMNSYDYGDHQIIREIINPSTNDSTGADGQWRPGDFVIHWAAGDLNLRLKLAPLYQGFINYKIDYTTLSAAIKQAYL